MNLRQAKVILSPYLPAGAVTAESVRAAFAGAVKSLHPDSSRGMAESTGCTRGQSLADTKTARDTWLTELGAKAKAPCPICRGTGRMGRGFDTGPCVKGCKP